MSVAKSPCLGLLRPLATATAIVLVASGAVSGAAAAPSPATAASGAPQAALGMRTQGTTAQNLGSWSPADSTGYTQNPTAKLGNELYFFDFSKLASGSVFYDSGEKRPRRMLAEGATYTFTSADGLPHGMRSKVTVTNIRKPDVVATQRPLESELGVAAARSVVEYSDIFRASGVANYGEGGYHAPDEAWWLLTQARRPNSEEARRWNSTEIVAGSMAFDVTVETFFDDGTGSKRVHVPLVAIDGEASNPANGGTTRARDALTIVTDGAPWELLQKIDTPQNLAGGKARFETTTEITPNTSWQGSRTYTDVKTEFTNPRMSAPIVKSDNAKTLKVTLTDPNFNGGRSGVVLGLQLPYDTGDAPASYGQAVHMLGAANGPHVGVKAPTANLPYESGLLDNDREEDVTFEGLSTFGTRSDVAFPLVVTRAGESAPDYTAKIPVRTGDKDAYVSAWIDLDKNGRFDATERATKRVPAGSTFAELTWPIGTWKQGGLFPVRVRVSSVKEAVERPSDITSNAPDGEVEDLQMYVVRTQDAITTGEKNRMQYSSDDEAGLTDLTGVLGPIGARITNTPVDDGRAMFGLDAAPSPAHFSWALKGADGKPAVSLPVSVDGEEAGTYSINSETGVVSFKPTTDFVGVAPTVTVQLLVQSTKIPQPTAFPRLEAKYTARVLGVHGTVAEAEVTGNTVGQRAQITLRDELTNIAPDTLRFTPENAGELSADGRTLSTSEGTWVMAPSISGDSARVTFTPKAGFAGTPTAVYYTGSDLYGAPPQNGSALLRATYIPVVTVDAATYGPQGLLRQFSTDKTVADGDLGLTAREMFPGLPDAYYEGARYSISVPGGVVNPNGTITLSKQGVYEVDAATGVVTFHQSANFAGYATPVTVTMTTSGANNAMSFEAKYAPRVHPSTAKLVDARGEGEIGAALSGYPGNKTGPKGDGSANDTWVKVGTYGFLAPGSPEGATGSSQYTVSGQGTWHVWPDGKMSFVPVRGFTGTEVSVRYTAKDNNGTQLAPATVRVTYPEIVTKPIETIAPQGVTQFSWDTGDALLDGRPESGMVMTDAIPGMPANTFISLGAPSGGTVKSTSKTPAEFGGFTINEVVEVAGVGTYSLTSADANGRRGVIFTPLPEFHGKAPAITVTAITPLLDFQTPSGTVKTGEARYSTTFTPTVTQTIVTLPNDAREGVLGEPTELMPAFDADIDLSTVEFVKPAGATLEGDGQVLLVPGEGEWIVDDRGLFQFTPYHTFNGSPTPVEYTARNTNGVQAQAPGKITVTYPQVQTVNVVSTGTQGLMQLGVMVDGSGQATGTPALGSLMYPNVPSELGTVAYHYLVTPSGQKVSVLEKPGVGTYTINKETGAVSFVPDEYFVGVAPSVEISLTTTSGHVFRGATYTPTVTRAFPDVVEQGQLGRPVKVTIPYVTPSGPTLEAPNDALVTCGDTSSLICKSTVKFVGVDTNADGSGDPIPPAPAPSEDGKTLVVPGQGTWTIDSSGNVHFTPEPNFFGDPSSVLVQGKDLFGRDTTVGIIKVRYPVLLVQDSTTVGLPGETQTSADVDAGDRGVQTMIGYFDDPADDPLVGASYAISVAGVESDDPHSVTVPGQGTYTLTHDPATNEHLITFAPVASFRGTATPVTLTVTPVDTANFQSITATYTPTVRVPSAPGVDEEELPPTAEGEGGYGETVRIPLDVPPGLDLSTVVFDPSKVPSGSVITEDGKVVTVPGEGRWEIEMEDEELVFSFSPEPGFTGPATRVGVTGYDFTGTLVDSVGVLSATILEPTGAPVLRHPDGAAGVSGKVPRGKLAKTGAEIGDVTLVGTVLAAVGAMLLGARRKYRDEDATN